MRHQGRVRRVSGLHSSASPRILAPKRTCEGRCTAGSPSSTKVHTSGPMPRTSRKPARSAINTSCPERNRYLPGPLVTSNGACFRGGSSAASAEAPLSSSNICAVCRPDRPARSASVSAPASARARYIWARRWHRASASVSSNVVGVSVLRIPSRWVNARGISSAARPASKRGSRSLHRARCGCARTAGPPPEREPVRTG